MRRQYYHHLWTELSQDKRMILIAGPRQSGKTTLSKQIQQDYFNNSIYFNWDISTDRSQLLEDPYFYTRLSRKDTSIPLVVLDEIHK